MGTAIKTSPGAQVEHLSLVKVLLALFFTDFWDYAMATATVLPQGAGYGVGECLSLFDRIWLISKFQWLVWTLISLQMFVIHWHGVIQGSVCFSVLSWSCWPPSKPATLRTHPRTPKSLVLHRVQSSEFFVWRTSITWLRFKFEAGSDCLWYCVCMDVGCNSCEKR